MSDRLKQITVVVAILLLVSLPWLLWRTTLPLEIDPNEAWNGWWANAVVTGEPLYPGGDALIINNYPPLYFYLLAAASRWAGGDMIFIGRVISLLASAIITLNILILLQRFWRVAPLPAVFAALWFAALLLTYFSRYTGMNDPQLAALAIMTTGLSLLLTASKNSRFVAATALIVMAGFMKHSLWAIPLATMIYFAFTSWHRTQLFVTTGALVSGAGLALCYAIWGQDFFSQLMLPRNSDWQNGTHHLPGLLWLYPAVAYALWSWWKGERSAPRSLAQLLLWSALAVDIFQRRGDGVDINAELELAVAVAIWMGLAAQRLAVLGLKLPAFAIVLVLVLAPLLATFPVNALRFYQSAWREDIWQRAQLLDSEVARVAAMQGKVACSHTSICFRAGKANVYDGFATTQRQKRGFWSEQMVQQKLAAARIIFAQIDARVAW